MIKRFALGALVVLALAGCGSDADGVHESGNTDPRAGWVEFQDDAWKLCDGTVMVYATTTGAAVVPNHRECGGY